MGNKQAVQDVLQETWQADFDDIYGAGEEVSLATFHGDGRARARIAACAPEALRMLLEAEWVGSRTNSYQEHEAWVCPSCKGDEPGSLPDGYKACDGSRPIHTDHVPDCAWLALMVKAGLR